MKTYSIMRLYHPIYNLDPEIIKKGLTLEEAQKHCKQDRNDPKNKFFDVYADEEALYFNNNDVNEYEIADVLAQEGINNAIKRYGVEGTEQVIKRVYKQTPKLQKYMLEQLWKKIKN